MKISQDCIRDVIRYYTREAGVRALGALFSYCQKSLNAN